MNDPRPVCIKCRKQVTPLLSVQTPECNGMGQAMCSECAKPYLEK